MANETVVVTEDVISVVEVSATQILLTTETATETIEVGLAGPQGATGATGAQGIPGPQGPPGAATASYQHVQTVASATWTIVHNLGFEPNIIAFDSTHRQILGERADPDVNTAILTFSGAVSGRATAS